MTCTATNSRGMSATRHLRRPRLRRPAQPGLDHRHHAGPRRLPARRRCEPGQALWYRFPVQPDSTVEVDLTELAANYDLTLFGDIGAAFDDALTTRDLDRLGAEFAADAFSPSAFSPSAPSAPARSRPRRSPPAPSPLARSAPAPSPRAPSARPRSPPARSALRVQPERVQPLGLLPRSFCRARSARRRSAPARSRPTQLRDAFSSAQVRSLIAVSARDGLADESIRVSTWNATGYFYVRVLGRNGAFAARQTVPAVGVHRRAAPATPR